jgi:hypothetical protein
MQHHILAPPRLLCPSTAFDDDLQPSSSASKQEQTLSSTLSPKNKRRRLYLLLAGPRTLRRALAIPSRCFEEQKLSSTSSPKNKRRRLHLLLAGPRTLRRALDIPSRCLGKPPFQYDHRFVEPRSVLQISEIYSNSDFNIFERASSGIRAWPKSPDAARCDLRDHARTVCRVTSRLANLCDFKILYYYYLKAFHEFSLAALRLWVVGI